MAVPRTRCPVYGVLEDAGHAVVVLGRGDEQGVGVVDGLAEGKDGLRLGTGRGFQVTVIEGEVEARVDTEVHVIAFVGGIDALGRGRRRADETGVTRSGAQASGDAQYLH